MFHKRLTSRLVPIVVCGAVIVAMAAPARSERLHDERACVTAFKKARGHEQSGRLQDAKELLMSCAQAPCGGFLRQQCSNKYNQLESDTPSVVLIVTDASGAPRADIQVRMDGEVFAPQLDGRALTVDPGMHEFTFSADGAVFATQKVMIVQGQRNRFITAVARGAGAGSGGGTGKQRRMVAQSAEKEGVTPASASAPRGRLSGTAKVAVKEAAKDKDEEESSAAPSSDSEPGARGVASLTDAPVASDDKSDDTIKKSGSILPYIVGGLGLASIGGAAVLTYWGRKDNDNLGQCAPSCSPTATDHIKRLYLGADVALGVGVVALGAAYWIHVVTGREQQEKPTEQALRFNVLPTPSGGFATVAGRF
jgi:hypothetical protein